jgi:hypothetical protein
MCYNVADVSTLGGVWKLNLSCYKGVVNVSVLGQVHDLNLGCCNVYDILNIKNCDSVIDITALVNVHTLLQWAVPV